MDASNPHRGDVGRDPVEQIRASSEYKIAKDQFADREWRLNHLYWIKNADGDEIQFKRNFPQVKYSSEQWFRDVIVKARQLGFSTEIQIEMLDDCLFRKNTRAAIVDATLDDAKIKLGKILFAYERAPRVIRETVRLKRANTEEIEFTNGSKISVGTTFRGDTAQWLHVSEFGKIAADKPDRAKEIRTGSFNAVGKGGKIAVESTAHGTGGEFYDLVERAKATQLSGLELTPLDFKLHFFAWWMNPAYTLPANTVLIPQHVRDYINELHFKFKIPTLQLNQIAWYAKMLAEHGRDDMMSEYPSHIGETFFNSIEGAFFKQEMSRAREDKRIGLPVPFDPHRPVNTFWDIGMDDETAIWFHQTDGVRHRFIDYYANSGETLPHYWSILQQKQRERGFTYGKHYGPHDLEVREWGSPTAKTRRQAAAELGLNFVVVPRVQNKADAIDAARRFLATTFIDSTHCDEKGTKALDNYRKKWNKTLGVWSGDEVEDWACHGADALMTGVMGLAPERLNRQKQHRHDSARNSGPSHWSS